MQGVPPLGTLLPAWSALPFLGILLSIALVPLVAPGLWHRHYPKFALGWAVLLAAPFLWVFRGRAAHELLQTGLTEYLPFVVLLAALFAIGGGIHLRGRLSGSPLANTAVLAAGALSASFLGTTGAAMILIRPLLRANQARRHCAHTVVFFIFLVGNVGGALTPLGDPPLFLGFLAGVPFFWTLTLAPEMLFVSALVLAVYFALDLWFCRREGAPAAGADGGSAGALGIDGGHNLLYLAGVLAAVVLSGAWHPGAVDVLGVREPIESLLRDGVLILLLGASWWTTAPAIRAANGFSWKPMREVAILFAAIFATILPVLAILGAGERGTMAPLLQAVRRPAHYFWAAGGLSALLDNAPTYLAFLSTALGRYAPGLPLRQAVRQLIASHPDTLRAISTGAVFMGALTYLGNAPNLMVKSIAEHQGVEMPSFFRYIGLYALPVLVPIFLLVTWIFF